MTDGFLHTIFVLSARQDANAFGMLVRHNGSRRRGLDPPALEAGNMQPDREPARRTSAMGLLIDRPSPGSNDFVQRLPYGKRNVGSLTRVSSAFLWRRGSR